MLLRVRNLKVTFQTRAGAVPAVDGVSFDVEQGKTLCLVGESGSGKSVTATSILRLLDENAKTEGELLFDERDSGEYVDLQTLSAEEMRRIRGNKISMIFQEPMTALNPVFTVKKQLCEPFILHRNADKKTAEQGAKAALQSVRIPNAERVLKSYPHELSGGMRQRVMIAMALACQPKLLIADEPTTALDVSVQVQILRLMRTLQAEVGAAILFITHDLGVVNEMADYVAVMYCGRIVEYAPKSKIFRRKGFLHPYTEGLFASLPENRTDEGELECIPGNVPHPLHLPKGCKFAPRCKYCTARCVERFPSLTEVEKGHFISCFYPSEEERKSERHAELVIGNPS
ncbi:MAG: ABC transporter ATP-binding protein [Clostridia bacterium]|nr:ABC transporter ATP-binding protein [Clostridia bacterium]